MFSPVRILGWSPVSGRAKLKAANAFSCNDHRLLWLAGGTTVNLAPSKSEELFNTLDEAVKKYPLDFVHHAALVKEWETG